ncbi:DNA polymerase Y family protein [Parvularcula flava]|uniref:DNA-directed DNA polymerase n=1 Tax=Aquisalinus luteolus TaxID=1566827 RepID=A0A8J3EQA5_9PROT|nr:DNA polymerase Y family protein [Aquisalinus luteolus]NHK27186.1 DNA polymerase Y family protein [Aquisalinus luteolus]GGH94669.1 nucleotidyltransferase [Aquisalinus luteolus]
MPRLPVNRAGRTGIPVDDWLFALTQEEKGAVRLSCVNHHASKAGLAAGMSLTDARAIAPALVTLPAEPRKDAAFLSALQRWAEKFSPWTACDGADGLILNITGCAHLFGGEEAMLALIRQELADFSIDAMAGIADTKGAARAAARFGGTGRTIIAPGEARAALAPYPVEAMVADDKTLFDLKRLGLTSIGDLYGLKSAELARRVGFGFVRGFEKLFGSAADPVIAQTARPTYSARMSFPDPIGLIDDVEEALRRLTAQICKRLVEHDDGARAFELTFQRTDKTGTILSIGLARPSQTPDLVIRQFAQKITRVDAGLGIDVMRLRATVTEPFRPVQQSFAGPQKQSELEELIATLGNRLGFDRVLRWEPVSSHLPRRSFRLVSAAGKARSVSFEPPASLRPLTMVGPDLVEITAPGRPPKGFVWRGEGFQTASAKGPERIGHEWWLGTQGDAIRDYWSVQTCQGPRLWLSTRPDLKPSIWEVAGVFP